MHDSKIQPDDRQDSFEPVVKQMAHDLNNVLSIVDGAARVLKKNLSKEASDKALDRIEQAVKRGANLAQDLGNLYVVRDGIEKTLEGDQLSFKVVGMTALLVGKFPATNFLKDSGFEILTAEDGNHALLVQEDHLGDIDMLSFVEDSTDLEDMDHCLGLFSALREETQIIPFESSDAFIARVYRVAQSMIK